jgi:hypothetical protein
MVSTMRSNRRSLLLTSDEAGIDWLLDAVGLIVVNDSTTNPVMIGKAVDIAAREIGIGMESLTTLYRAYLSFPLRFLLRILMNRYSYTATAVSSPKNCVISDLQFSGKEAYLL